MNLDATLYPDGISMLRAVPPATLLYAIANAASYVEAADAINECKHGRVATDSAENRARAGCDCFDRVWHAPEPAAPRNVATEVRDYGKAMARLQRPATSVVHLDVPVFLANMADEADARIAELLAEADKVRAFKEAITHG